MARGRRRSCCGRWCSSTGRGSCASRRSRIRRSRTARLPAPAPAPARASSSLLHRHRHLHRHPIIAPARRAPMRALRRPAAQYAGLGARAVSELSTLSLVACASLRVCCVCTSRGGVDRRSSALGAGAEWVAAECVAGSLRGVAAEGAWEGVAGAPVGVEDGGLETLARGRAASFRAFACEAAAVPTRALLVVRELLRAVDVMRSEVLEACLPAEPPQAATASAQSAAIADVNNVCLICPGFDSRRAPVRSVNKPTSCEAQPAPAATWPSISCQQRNCQQHV